ncbi:unnamed protein product [Closterium sp. NIES-54]
MTLRAPRALLPCSPVRPAALQPCAPLLPCCPVRPARPAAAATALVVAATALAAAATALAVAATAYAAATTALAAAATVLAAAATALPAVLRAPCALQPCAPRTPCCLVRPVRPAALCTRICSPMHSPYPAPPPPPLFSSLSLLHVQQLGLGGGEGRGGCGWWVTELQQLPPRLLLSLLTAAATAVRGEVGGCCESNCSISRLLLICHLLLLLRRVYPFRGCFCT